MNVPKNFIWGAASSSYQIEGAPHADGKGLSIWDTFSHTSGKTFNNHTGDVACNHYYDYLEDIKVMKELGIQAYRFSISWPRIFPNGDEVLNPAGLDFYDRLVDALIENDIIPYITLFHWDLPQVLEDKGGWLNRETADAFAYYAGTIAEHFSNRVENFITINEPQCIAYLGYGNGLHAPGKKMSNYAIMSVFHHVALAHGKAVTAMRAQASKPIKIGFASTGKLCYPTTETEDNIALARELTFTADKENWGFCHHIFGDAVILGKYPDLSLILEDYPSDFIEDGDMEAMCQPLDFYGINVYNGSEVNTEIDGYYVPKYEGFPRTALKWPVTPGVMNWGVRFIHERYGLPIYISENGLSCNDKIFLDGKVHDPDRIDFLHSYLLELEKVFQSDVALLGYFHWSLTDNYEWHNGYDEHFGLTYIDYRTQERIIKDSGYWYSNFIKNR